MTPLVRVLREKWWIWGIPTILLLLGVGFLANYLMALSGEGRSLLSNVSRTEAELEKLLDEADALEAKIEALSFNQDEIRRLYEEHLSTESERLTKILVEVKDLADQSGLTPSALNYQDEELESFDLKRKAFSFGVDGSYSNLRKLIHELEQSESFLTLEQIGLAETSGNALQIRLRISTIFATEMPR